VPVPEPAAKSPNGRLRLVYVGRLVEQQKRVSEVTRALCQAVSQVPNCEAVIYGDGPARRQVEEILHTVGHGLPVRLAGRVDSDAMQERMSGSHALVLLSDYEGLPIALMEAMACGVVPICLRIRSGIPELVEDGVTGLLVDNRGSSFVDAVRRLRVEPGLWDRLSLAARARIEAGYTSEQGAERWAEMLHQLHGETAQLQGVRYPRQVEAELPPVHPDLAHEDQRTPRSFVRFYRFGRRLVGHAKRRILGSGHA
jgi:glycosyltransferase involved in cell wall biosynthesis